LYVKLTYGPRSLTFVRSSAFRRWGLESARTPDRVNAELRTETAHWNHCRDSSEGQGCDGAPFGVGPGRLIARVALGVFRWEFRLQAVGPEGGAYAGPRQRGTPNGDGAAEPLQGFQRGQRRGSAPFGAGDGPGRLTARVVLGVFRSEFRLQAVGPVAATHAGPRKRGTPNGDGAVEPLQGFKRGATGRRRAIRGRGLTRAAHRAGRARSPPLGVPPSGGGARGRRACRTASTRNSERGRRTGTVAGVKARGKGVAARHSGRGSDPGGSPRGSRSESSVRSSAFRRWGLESARGLDRVNAELRTGMAHWNRCRVSSEGPRAAARRSGPGSDLGGSPRG